MRKAQVNAMETERLGIIHVSDVIKPCMRYVVYSKITPRTTIGHGTSIKKFFVIE